MHFRFFFSLFVLIWGGCSNTTSAGVDLGGLDPPLHRISLASIISDLDQDGLSEIVVIGQQVVESNGEESFGPDVGVIYSGRTLSPIATSVGETAGAPLWLPSSRLHPARDLDGDGVGDLLVLGVRGTVDVWRGRGEGTTFSDRLQAEMSPSIDAVANVSIGRLDEDENSDWVVGSRGKAIVRPEGTVWSCPVKAYSVTSSSDAGLSYRTAWVQKAEQPASCRRVAAILGDVDGKGDADIAVVSWLEAAQSLSVTLYAGEDLDGNGSEDLPVAVATATVEDASLADGLMDLAVQSVKDLDNDDVTDLVLAYRATAGQGAVKVVGMSGKSAEVLFTADRWARSPLLVPFETGATDDFDGDSISDIFLSGYGVLSGVDARPIQVLWSEARPDASNARWTEQSLASAGDIDADGYADLLIVTTEHDLHLQGGARQSLSVVYGPRL
jgi:hypothetical protein